MPLRRAERKAKWEAFIREGIRQAAAQILAQRGARGLTMDNLARRAGVSKGTLYRYFKDKDEVAESAAQAALAPLERQLFEVLESALAPERKVEQLILTYLKFFAGHRRLVRLHLYDRERDQERGQRHSRYQILAAQLAGVLHQGIEAGVLRRMEVAPVAALLLETMAAMVRQRLVSEDAGPAEDDARRLAELFLRGIVEPRGGVQPTLHVFRKNTPSSITLLCRVKQDWLC